MGFGPAALTGRAHRRQQLRHRRQGAAAHVAAGQALGGGRHHTAVAKLQGPGERQVEERPLDILESFFVDGFM